MSLQDFDNIMNELNQAYLNLVKRFNELPVDWSNNLKSMSPKDYDKLINILSNFNKLFEADYFKAVNDARIVGLNFNLFEFNDLGSMIIESDKLTEAINSFYKSNDYAIAINNYKTNLINKFKLGKNVNVAVLSELKKIKESSDLSAINNLYQKLSNNDFSEKCCPECGYTNFQESKGRIVCPNCGLELDVICSEEERIMLSKDQFDKRKINEPVLKRFGSRTLISNFGVDFMGRKLSPATNALFNRLTKKNKHIVTTMERNYAAASFKLNRLKEDLKSDAVLEDAWKIYIKSFEKRLVRGRSIDMLLEGAVYASLKINNYALLMPDLIALLRIFDPQVTKNNVVRAYQLIINSGVLKELGYVINKLKVTDYARTYCSRISLKAELTNMVVGLVEKANSGFSPAGLIASALYLVLKDNRDYEMRAVINELNKRVKNNRNTGITQKLIAEYMHVTEVTLRNRAKTLESLLIP